jgi:4-cresol dehydrogenase (hydroxylating)
VVDCKRLNRVLAIDEDRAFALVEPGVSYFDLYREIEERGLALWIDCPDPGWGSVIGNALDRGCGYTAARFRNHWEAHCGLEVVTPTGEIVRTGMGAMPGAASWQDYRNGYGPVVDGLFSQGNFGIVTKMGIWLMPRPQGFRTAIIEVPRYDDIHELVRLYTLAENSRLFDGMPYFASPLLNVSNMPEAIGMEAPDRALRVPSPEQLELIAGAEVGYSPALERYGLVRGLPYWTLRLGFYGPHAVTGAQWEAVKALFANIEGVRFHDGKLVDIPVAEDMRERIHLPELGIPSLEIFQLVSRRSFNPAGSRGHIGFSPVIPRTGQAILDFNRVLGPILARMRSGWSGGFILPHLYWDRAFVCVIGLLLGEEPDENREIVALYETLVVAACEQGWGEYRTPNLFQDLVARTYDAGNGALLRFQERLKDAVDPAGIMAPGRYGIMPRRFRDDVTAGGEG